MCQPFQKHYKLAVRNIYLVHVEVVHVLTALVTLLSCSRTRSTCITEASSHFILVAEEDLLTNEHSWKLARTWCPQHWFIGIAKTHRCSSLRFRAEHSLGRCTMTKHAQYRVLQPLIVWIIPVPCLWSTSPASPLQNLWLCLIFWKGETSTDRTDYALHSQLLWSLLGSGPEAWKAEWSSASSLGHFAQAKVQDYKQNMHCKSNRQSCYILLTFLCQFLSNYFFQKCEKLWERLQIE